MNSFDGCVFTLIGTNVVSGGYVPSFYKKDTGSAGHRGLPGPSADTSASSELTSHSYRSLNI